MRIEFDLPDNCYGNYTEHQIKIIMSSALYDKGVIALGYAAEMVGMDKRSFIEEMMDYGVPVLKMTNEELKRHIKNAKERAEARKRRIEKKD